MTKIQAEMALLPEGWRQNIQVEIGDDGRIADVIPASNRSDVDAQVSCLLPAPVNIHSHAFQRAMTGLTERRGNNPQDSFWTWRELMYRFLDQLTPDHIEAITAMVQMEMLEAGYATNVEFHYLHHAPDGTHYVNRAEMAQRIIAAASQSGIGLVLLPVHYQFGGCDGRELTRGQIRFRNDPDEFALLCEDTRSSLTNFTADAGFGVAPHSLRAVAKDSFAQTRALATGGPFHMHLAEQIAEVDEVLHHLGKRPVEWVLDNIEPGDDCCFIHCTQMLPHETVGLARTGAVAGLCPITEASLGDGIFDGVNWLGSSGQIAIGSDSNIRISLTEELRSLEYSQRLRDRTRAALATSTLSTGRRIFEAMVLGGAQAAGRQTGKIATGFWADLMAVDDFGFERYNLEGDVILDRFIFAGDDRMIREVWSAGRHVVSGGSHIAREQISKAYQGVLASLRDRL